MDNDNGAREMQDSVNVENAENSLENTEVVGADTADVIGVPVESIPETEQVSQVPNSNDIKEVSSEPTIEVGQVLEVSPIPEQISTPTPLSSGEVPSSIAPIPTNKNFLIELLVKARSKIQFRRRSKLEKIMSLFAKKQEITNDGVEKLLHVSDSTATRYLEQLEKENKIIQSGNTGRGVKYTKN